MKHILKIVHKRAALLVCSFVDLLSPDHVQATHQKLSQIVNVCGFLSSESSDNMSAVEECSKLRNPSDSEGASHCRCPV